MVPILGVAHVGYIPNNRVVGISKLLGCRYLRKKTSDARNNDSSNCKYFR